MRIVVSPCSSVVDFREATESGPPGSGFYAKSEGSLGTPLSIYEIGIFSGVLSLHTLPIVDNQ